MVRRSALVYELLRMEKPQNGFTQKEIVEQISSKHDIVPGKALKRQVSVALRRGLDFGILAKRQNRYRFDPDYAKSSRVTYTAPRKRSQAKKKKRKTATPRRQRQTSDNKIRKQTPAVPRPKLPRPPSWTPRTRNIADEPVSKVRKVS